MTQTWSSFFFGDHAESYDALVNWPRRLANEAPFYRRLFTQVGVRRLLDVACGTGHHAALFHSWGLHVEGADVSPAMIAHCRKKHGESDTLRWVERPFEQPPDQPGWFDAVICVGNSLAIAADLPAVERTVAAMFAALRSGGVCVIQVLNLWAFPEGPTTWQKCTRQRRDDVDGVILKGIHRSGTRGYVDVVELKLTERDVDAGFDSATLLGIEAEELLAAIGKAGAAESKSFGTYQEAPYDRETSPDLILVARRR